MTHKVVWDHHARNDLMRFIEYLEKDNPLTAMKVASSIIEAGNILAKLPKIGRPMNDSTGRREFYKNVNSLRYVLRYYVEQDSTIRILRIWHSSEVRK